MVLYNDTRFITNSSFPDTDFMGDADFVIADDSELAKKIITSLPNFELVFDDNGDIIDVIKLAESVDCVINQKKSEISSECEKVIISGVDVGDEHYSLTTEDQTNISAWRPLAEAGKSVPYHADGESCRIFTAEEFLEVANTATFFIVQQRTYCNLLMRQVEVMTNTDEIKAVKYGITELTGEYAEQYQIIMASLVGDSSETNS